jgi:FAD/FMN-containing dehydrogenase
MAMQQMTARLAAIVGSEQVRDDGALLDGYALDHSDAPASRPVAIVRPGSAVEIQQVVAWANETATPLVPVSSGAPHFHGDTVPSAPGAVMLDLRRMDKVLRADRRNRMVVIEPGVTYPQLQAVLAEQGMRVTPPLLPRANKSVVASLLERQPTLIPRYNFALPEPLRDCGVVWGSGEVLFTGEAGSGSTLLEKQWEAGFVQAEAKGPAQTDFYRLLTGAQGTMGVVTWASVKCELLPEAHEVGYVTAGSLGELEPLVRCLCLSRLGDELMLFDRGYLGRILAGTGTSADPDALQAWTLVLGFGGRGFRSAERVRVQKEDATRLAGQVGLEVRGELPGVPVGAVDELLRGLSPAPHWKLAAAGGSADIFFLTTLDKIEGYVEIAHIVADGHGYAAEDVGVYIQPQHQGVTHHVEFSLPYDPSDPATAADMQELADDLAANLIAAGAYFSRPYGSWAQPVYNRDAAAAGALRRVKAIFDPAGVMNPGKLCFGAPAAPRALVAKEA